MPIMSRFASLLLLALLATRTAASAALAPGAQVPPLPVTTLDGTATSLTDLRGNRPLVLMVWCSSCSSCRGAEADFDRLATECRDKVPVYALASNPRETADAVRARQAQSAVSFPVVLDRDAVAADALGVTCTTTVLVIAKDGRLAYRGPLGQGGKGSARQALRDVIAGKRVANPDVAQIGCPVR
jgi:peroxiredoxin